MKAYKGFNPDMTCRGFKYEEGQTYETDKASICEEGFHACLNPMDCLQYYPPAESIYREVDIDGLDESEAAKCQEDSKVCGKKIAIGAKLSVKGLVEAYIDFMMAHCGKSDSIPPAINDKDSSMASNSGDRSMASNSGDSSMASNSGHRSMASNSGDEGIACAVGIEGMAKGCLGAWLVLAEWKWSDSDSAWHRIDVQCKKVDGNTIKADTYYRLINGEFVEA